MMGETASKGARNDDDDQAPAPSFASNCSQGGLWVLPMSTTTTKGTGAIWHQQQQQPSTCPQPCKQLLAGWIAGATNVDEDGEGNACVNDKPAPMSNCLQVFLLRSFFSFFFCSFFFCFVHSFFCFVRSFLFYVFLFCFVCFFVCFLSCFIILISLCR
jgi:hypothetical protein